MYDSREDTKAHINLVGDTISKLIVELWRRAKDHDKSKLEEPEKPIFDKYTPKLAGTTYGSEEYKEYLSEMNIALEHHYENNRHHPEWTESNLVEYRDIEGYEGKYQVSNYGDVKRLAREVVRERQGNFKVEEMILSSHVTPAGYHRVQISNDGVKSNFFIHRLVADAFIPKKEGQDQINHKDGNKGNNRLWNLERCDNSGNQIHAYATGLQKVGYVIHCLELDITTFGSREMERQLIERGYKTARASSILACVNGDSSHHLNLHFEGCRLEEYRRSQLAGMNLIDLLEMISDWNAAATRHNDGNIIKSIEINQDRFGYSDELKQILINTVVDYFGVKDME